MALTPDQILALAPDAGSAAAGRKLAARKSWKSFGGSARAIWGECQGSALYQVRADLSDLTTKCSCPSRKFPCKHGLGLLLLFAAEPVEPGEEPEWVAAWLDRRSETAARKEAKAQEPPKEETPADARAREKRSARRGERLAAGVEGLELFLMDLVRNGLGGLERQGSAFWEGPAARLVDAQAPGLARRLRRLSDIPGSRPDWPERLLGELGKLALLTHAARRLDALGPTLAAEVLQLVGQTVEQAEVLSGPDVATDRWTVVGQLVEEEDRLRTQRTWLVGEESGREALILQFSVAGAPFGVPLVPGTRFDADLAFFPGATPLRALVKARRGEPRNVGALPRLATVARLFERVADDLGRQPWAERFPACLGAVVPIRAQGRWFLADDDAVPLSAGDHWTLLALSGGRPIDVFGEWDGAALRPLGATADGAYHVLFRV